MTRRQIKVEHVGIALGAVVTGAFVAGLWAVSTVFPQAAEGPTPAATRVGYYAVFASFFVVLALIPLAMWAIDRRAGRCPPVAWRAITAVGVAAAMLAVGWGVRTWAYPPSDLRVCAPEYRGNSTTDVERIVCEGGRLNRPLGERRLDEGMLAAVVILTVTAVAAARLAPRPEGDVSVPGRRSPAAPPR
jgi:hypothetical protein